MGINVLLHGDGGTSFFDFPNQAVQGGLMGVAVLAPSESLLWGVTSGGPTGLDRPDGVAHMQALNDLVQTVIPQMVAFNSSNVVSNPSIPTGFLHILNMRFPSSSLVYPAAP